MLPLPTVWLPGTPFFSPFFGTSAAAPHAAAVAALVWSAKRSATGAQIYNAMTSTALDIRAPGIDRDSGYGIVMAPAAINAILH
jgi:subtilisin family serine protease